MQEGIIGFVVVGTVLLVAAPFIFFENSIMMSVVYYLRLAVLLLFGALLSGIALRIILCGGVRKYIKFNMIKNTVETNLISIGAYQKKKDVNYALLPNIKIKGNKIVISLRDIRIRERIVKSLDSFSTALPSDYVVEDYYITSSNNDLVIQFESVKKYKQETYTVKEYRKMIEELEANEFYIDRKHNVNILDHPHLLYSGGTGSGKSYAALQLVAQAIIKGWDVTVLDIKRSYGIYRKYIDYEVEPETIISKLKMIEQEMYIRLKDLEPLLNSDPRALATDCGYKNKMVLIEEYISLQSALDKKQKDELERIVKNLSVLARQACIHIVIVMQSAGTENINSSTRAQFTKILLGNAQSNILNATFGNGVDIPTMMVRMNKGDGLIQLDRITIVRIPNIVDIEQIEL